MGYTQNQLIKQLKFASVLLGKIPTKKEFDSIDNLCSSSAIRKRFGRWSTAIRLALNADVRRLSRSIIQCPNCGRNTKNPKFCSSSCSTSFLSRNENGRRIGRKRASKHCDRCGRKIYGRRNCCDGCLGKVKAKDGSYIAIDILTKGDLITQDTQAYRRIREKARQVASELKLLNECAICEYNLHVECCHKRPIHEFGDDSPISEINDETNLIGLCPNCHWEFDNGHLDLSRVSPHFPKVLEG